MNSTLFDSPKQYNYLALGDSYTIVESVGEIDNFPHQVVRFLADKKLYFDQPHIIAKTGWTTDELAAAIKEAEVNGSLLSRYDFVTLLAGVNNQYRGRSIENYKSEFEDLLKTALKYADQIRDHVIILSIPDWGVTPYANGADRSKIAREIDQFNDINLQLANSYGTRYLNITEWTREAANDITLIAPDGLHPSALEYRRWAFKISDIIAMTFTS